MTVLYPNPCYNEVCYKGTGLNLRVRNRKILFLFLNQNICCGYSKEPFH